MEEGAEELDGLDPLAEIRHDQDLDQAEIGVGADAGVEDRSWAGLAADASENRHLYQAHQVGAGDWEVLHAQRVAVGARVLYLAPWEAGVAGVWEEEVGNLDQEGLAPALDQAGPSLGQVQIDQAVASVVDRPSDASWQDFPVQNCSFSFRGRSESGGFALELDAIKFAAFPQRAE